jgi:hypothetical protein
MRAYLMPTLGVMAIVALVLTVFQYQANAQQPQQEDEIAVVGLFEQGTSGFTGTAVLKSAAMEQQSAAPQQQAPGPGQTEVIVGVVREPGFFDIFDPNDVGITRTSGVHAGTCEEVGAVVYEIGELMRLGPPEQQQDDQQDMQGEVYAARGMVQAGMDDLLTGQNILVVFEHEVDEEGQEEIQLIACGHMLPELRMPQAPMQ